MASEYHCSAASACGLSRGTRLIASSVKLEAVDVVEHAHVEGRGCRALFLVAAHVDVVVVVPPVSEPVNQPRIAVEGKDNGYADGKMRIELFVWQAVRMLGGRLQAPSGPPR